MWQNERRIGGKENGGMAEWRRQNPLGGSHQWAAVHGVAKIQTGLSNVEHRLQVVRASKVVAARGLSSCGAQAQ